MAKQKQGRFALFGKAGKRVGTAYFFGKTLKGAMATGASFLRKKGLKNIKARKKGRARRKR